MQLTSDYLNSFLIKFEHFLIGLAWKFKVCFCLKLTWFWIFCSCFGKMGDFLIQKHCGASLKKVKLTSFFHLGDPPPTFLFFEKTLTMLYSRHDFIFPSLTFWSSLSCRIEAAIFVLLSVKHSDDLLHFTADWSNKSQGASKQQFSRCIGKNNLCNCKLFGKLLMDPDDKIQRFIIALLRFCLVRFFVVKCLIFFHFS